MYIGISLIKKYKTLILKSYFSRAIRCYYIYLTKEEMMKKLVLMAWICLCVSSIVEAQEIVYSNPADEESRISEYEIVGKMDDGFHVYKNIRSRYYIHVYDSDMHIVQKKELAFLPLRTLSVEFVNYAGYYYILYQYQSKNIVHLMASRVEPSLKFSKPVELDTTEISFSATSRLYSIVTSENKNYIAAFKINTKKKSTHTIISAVFDKDLNFYRKTVLNIPVDDKKEVISEFNLDNDGQLVFLKSTAKNKNDDVNKISVFSQAADANDAVEHTIDIPKIYLDDPVLKINNATGEYLVAAMYATKRNGNIEGIFVSSYNKNTNSFSAARAGFSENLRSEARGESSTKTAFNDYYIQNIFLRKDGGFLLFAESMYTSSRGNYYNRWDYGPGSFNSHYDYYMFRGSPYYSPWSPTYMYNVTRYFADNILLLSFNNEKNLEWNGVMQKSQYDDNSAAALSYAIMNSGNALHILYNSFEKRGKILNDNLVLGDGEIKRNPTIKNLDKGYEFLPRQAKQVSAREMIIPCLYRNYVCFAKVEY